jgi:hypothetical protein
LSTLGPATSITGGSSGLGPLLVSLCVGLSGGGAGPVLSGAGPVLSEAGLVVSGVGGVDGDLVVEDGLAPSLSGERLVLPSLGKGSDAGSTSAPPEHPATVIRTVASNAPASVPRRLAARPVGSNRGPRLPGASAGLAGWAWTSDDSGMPSNLLTAPPDRVLSCPDLEGRVTKGCDASSNSVSPNREARMTKFGPFPANGAPASDIVLSEPIHRHDPRPQPRTKRTMSRFSRSLAITDVPSLHRGENDPRTCFAGGQR